MADTAQLLVGSTALDPHGGNVQRTQLQRGGLGPGLFGAEAPVAITPLRVEASGGQRRPRSPGDERVGSWGCGVLPGSGHRSGQNQNQRLVPVLPIFPLSRMELTSLARTSTPVWKVGMKM